MINDSLQDEMELNRIELFLQGNQQALGEIYDKYAPSILGVITRIVKDEEIAEACLTKCFQDIWSQKQSLDLSNTRFFTWMIKIARKTCINHLTLNKKILVAQFMRILIWHLGQTLKTF